MKLKVLKDESKELIVEFDTGDLTIPDLIASELLNDENTEFAGASKDHPETGKVVLVLRSKKTAKSELLKAIDRIDENFAEIKGQFGSSRRSKK